MDLKDIKDLIFAIDSTDIENVQIEKDDMKISISKGNLSKDNIVKERGPIQERVIDIEETVAEKVEEEDLFIVKSPIVGVFYSSPSPEEAPFVKVGSRVEKGDTLCIIEAMKIMNEIASEVSGEVVEILVDDEGVVEYGQAMMKIRR